MTVFVILAAKMPAVITQLLPWANSLIWALKNGMKMPTRMSCLGGGVESPDGRCGIKLF